MSVKEQKTVMYDAPEAAEQVSLTLWKSLDGRVFRHEQDARYASCTHRPCNACEAPAEKAYTHCRGCRDLLDLKRWQQRPLVEWDGNPVYSDDLHRWFDSPEDAVDYVYAEDVDDERDIDERLMLRDSKPVTVRELDESHWADDYPDEHDGPGPDWLVAAIDAFNEAVRGKVLSFAVGPNRVAAKEVGRE